MNGEINGIMDKSLDSPADLSNIQDDHKNSDAKDDHDDTESDSSTNVKGSVLITQSITVDDGSSIETKTNSDSEQSDSNSIHNNDDKIILVREAGTVKMAIQDDNCVTAENECGNSNDSYTGSETSSQAKSIEQLKITSIDIKYNYTGKDTSNSCDNTQNSDNTEESSDDCSEPKADDAVSINSDSGDDGSSQGSDNKLKRTEVILIDNDRSDTQNGNSHDAHSPEVHEIESDNDETFTEPVVEKPKSNTNNSKTVLRRSSRTIKRRKFSDEIENGDDSEVEEIEMLDPLRHKMRPIVINDTKTLVEMAAKHTKASQNDNKKKEPTVVIIDTHANKQTINKTQPSINSTNAQTLYQNMIARGTTVTPVSSKSNATNNNSSSQTQTILPSLTDDMYVVEAPSFIVPYVYEKPSLQPFREFVDILGKELEEQKAKEDKERLEKNNKEKEKRAKEMHEKITKGEEEVEESEEDVDMEKKKKTEKRERRRHGNDDDDASWDGESSSESEDDVISDEEDKILKDKVDPIDDIKDVTDIVTDKTVGKSESYFDCSLGKFFMDIGYNLVQEFVQSDLLKQQNRKLNREKKSGHSTKATESSIASLMKNLELSKENNAPYAYLQNKCQFCTFKTESTLVMANHLETPHMKNNLYKCNFCEFEIRSPHDILRHMKAEHNIVGKLEKAPSYHECPNCPFEDNGKGKLARHQIPCAKKFKPAINLSPPIEWEPPAKIPKITKSRSNVMGPYQNQFNRHVGNNINRPMSVTNMAPGGSFRPRGRAPLSMPPRGAPIPVHGAPIIRGGVMIRHNSPAASSNYPTKNKPGQQPSISITPLPRQPQPAQAVQNVQASKGSFVICEICDGYIKDLEQLRNHMQWIHKVKIHPKMIYNRPPLNCQKCQFRFFTDQGLERHLLGSHGLVTSSMQEAANKGKDAGRCPVCGRVYQWKLLNHVARDHNLTLKPAHLSYKCTVCTATFGMYKLFENHVYSAHSVVAKRVMDKNKNNTPSAKASANNDSLLKPLKINDEITIIPQPVKASAANCAKDK
ncbi:uncharacterized protein DDB_G0284459 [Bombyx mori]|uniref:MOG interacting and ectopic P-granules protein 1 n=1 Tax=Bombyx mori TaxID=7091 RepID=A0A8R2QWC2_BOMMO|nr:uncharacterized protein DDB_G0284459 [Bombyx mori]